jgi:hypothetical protein
MVVLLTLFVSACGWEEPPRRNPADLDPPGVITHKDPRWRGIPEEVGDEKGAIFSKKIYPNEKKSQNNRRRPAPR